MAAVAQKVRIEFRDDGFKALLRSREVGDELKRRTDAIAEAAGDGFEAQVWFGGFGGGRLIGTVRSGTVAAARAEAEDKALTRAIDAGR